MNFLEDFYPESATSKDKKEANFYLFLVLIFVAFIGWSVFKKQGFLVKYGFLVVFGTLILVGISFLKSIIGKVDWKGVTKFLLGWGLACLSAFYIFWTGTFSGIALVLIAAGVFSVLPVTKQKLEADSSTAKTESMKSNINKAEKSVGKFKRTFVWSRIVYLILFIIALLIFYFVSFH